MTALCNSQMSDILSLHTTNLIYNNVFIHVYSKCLYSSKKTWKYHPIVLTLIIPSLEEIYRTWIIACLRTSQGRVWTKVEDQKTKQEQLTDDHFGFMKLPRYKWYPTFVINVPVMQRRHFVPSMKKNQTEVRICQW